MVLCNSYRIFDAVYFKEAQKCVSHNILFRYNVNGEAEFTH